MKKFLVILAITVLALGICSCSILGDNTVKSAEFTVVPQSVYTSVEIDSGITGTVKLTMEDDTTKELSITVTQDGSSTLTVDGASVGYTVSGYSATLGTHTITIKFGDAGALMHTYKVVIDEINKYFESVDADGTYHIANAQQFANIIYANTKADYTNSSASKFVLDNDIDFGGSCPWEDNDTAVAAFVFQDTLDGNGHTIKNFYSDKVIGIHPIGLLYQINNCKIQNLTLNNVVIDSSAKDGKGAGLFGGNPKDDVEKGSLEFINVTINSNCKVIAPAGNVGGFIGYGRNYKSISFTNCTNGAYVKTDLDSAAGFIGTALSSNVTFDGCTNSGIIIGGYAAHYIAYGHNTIAFNGTNTASGSLYSTNTTGQDLTTGNIDVSYKCVGYSGIISTVSTNVTVSGTYSYINKSLSFVENSGVNYFKFNKINDTNAAYYVVTVAHSGRRDYKDNEYVTGGNLMMYYKVLSPSQTSDFSIKALTNIYYTTTINDTLAGSGYDTANGKYYIDGCNVVGTYTGFTTIGSKVITYRITAYDSNNLPINSYVLSVAANTVTYNAVSSTPNT